MISQKTVISKLCIDAIYVAQRFKENESATIQKMTCLVSENQTIDRVLCNLAAWSAIFKWSGTLQQAGSRDFVQTMKNEEALRIK